MMANVKLWYVALGCGCSPSGELDRAKYNQGVKFPTRNRGRYPRDGGISRVKNLVQAAIKHFGRHQRMKNWYLISQTIGRQRIPGVLWMMMGGVSESDIRFVDGSIFWQSQPKLRRLCFGSHKNFDSPRNLAGYEGTAGERRR